jgi:hypothetical protein
MRLSVRKLASSISNSPDGCAISARASS